MNFILYFIIFQDIMDGTDLCSECCKKKLQILLVYIAKNM